ncbi:MAG: ABC transporter permease, partial [Candidatus Firestonebacteria bacterium]
AAGTPVTLLNRRQERVFLPKTGKNKLFHYFAAAAALSIALGLAKIISPVSAFFLGGALALVSGIMVFDTLMKRAVVSGVTGLVLRSVFFNRKRSLLAVSLIASAAFIMIIVSAAVKNPEAENVYAPSSGSGGFDLAAGSEVPLFFDLNTAEGRKLNGMEESPRYKGMEAFMLRLRKGEDISCLNLGQPSDPGVLGVPAELIKRGGFKAGNFLKNLPRGWEALNAELPGGAIPAFADANSLQWILHKKVGDEITAGGARLKIVGTLSESIFAGELLVAEKNFVKVYGASGYNYFLFKCLPEEHAEALKILRTALPLAGFDVRETKDILKRYASIQNIYIMTFKLLGGLGFLLGILGITAVMLKSVLERKSEFAVMRSFGYSAGSLVLLVLAENTLLMLAGFLIGGISAVIAALPQAFSGAGNFDWTGSFGFIALVFTAGLTACAAGAYFAMRGDPVRSLRSE